jgi:translation elongation factor P/translation initiation factor 5A
MVSVHWLQLELRDLQSGAKQQHRKRPADTVDVVMVEGRPYQFMYKEQGSRPPGESLLP